MVYRFIIICCFFPLCLPAQINATLQDSIIVRDNRMQLPLVLQNRNISIMTRKEIKALPVTSVNELLAYVAGVDIRQRGPRGVQADVSIDGSTFDQVLVLINGVKVSDPQTGHNMMNLSLPLAAIDHIEVLKGPAARAYGVNALAGAINIVTAVPKTDGLTAQLYSGSSFKSDTATGEAFYSWGAQANANIAGEKHAHSFGAAHDRGNGYRHNTAYMSSKVYYENRIVINSKNDFNALGIWSQNRFGANGYYSSPGDKESTEAVETALGSISYTHRPTAKIRISPRLSYRYNKDDYIYIRQKPEVYHNVHESNVINAELQSTITTSKGLVGLGVEWRKEDINSTNLGKRERSNTGLYAEYRHQFGVLNLSAGMYANHNSTFGWQLLPGADAGVQLTPRLKLFASFSTGQRLPTYTDLYYDGPLNTGNDQLWPEQATCYEAGLHHQLGIVSLKGSYFYRNITGFIDWTRMSDTLQWQPMNYLEMKTSGISLQANLPLSTQLNFSKSYRFDLNFSYNYLNPEMETNNELVSKYTLQALRHQFVGRFVSKWFERFDVNLSCRYQQRLNANDYTLLDLRAGWHLKNLLLYVDVNNLLDQQYREIGTVQLPGRWMTAGIRFDWVAGQ